MFYSGQCFEFFGNLDLLNSGGTHCFLLTGSVGARRRYCSPPPRELIAPHTSSCWRRAPRGFTAEAWLPLFRAYFGTSSQQRRLDPTCRLGRLELCRRSQQHSYRPFELLATLWAEKRLQNSTEQLAPLPSPSLLPPSSGLWKGALQGGSVFESLCQATGWPTRFKPVSRVWKSRARVLYSFLLDSIQHTGRSSDLVAPAGTNQDKQDFHTFQHTPVLNLSNIRQVRFNNQTHNHHLSRETYFPYRWIFEVMTVIVIPSSQNDPVNFKTPVLTLQTLEPTCKECHDVSQAAAVHVVHDEHVLVVQGPGVLR